MKRSGIEIEKKVDQLKILNHYVFIDAKLKNPKSLFHVKCFNDECKISFGCSRTTIQKYQKNKQKLICPECAKKINSSIPKIVNIPFVLPDGYITINEYQTRLKDDLNKITDEILLDRANNTFKHLGLELISITRTPRSYTAICPTCNKIKSFSDGTLRTMPEKVQCKECRYPGSLLTTITKSEINKNFSRLNPDDYFTIIEVESKEIEEVKEPQNGTKDLASLLENLIGEVSFKELLIDKISTLLAEKYSTEILSKDFIN